MKRAAVDHPKFQRLQRRLSLTRFQAIGLLEALWHFTGRYAQQGDIGRWEDEEIAGWMEWNGDSSELLETLVSCGWLDRHPVYRLVVHDWHEHADEATKIALKRARKVFAVGTETQPVATLSRQKPNMSGPPEPEPCTKTPPKPPSRTPERCGGVGFGEAGVPHRQSRIPSPNPETERRDSPEVTGLDLMPDGSRRLTGEQLSALEELALQVTGSEFVPAEPMRFYRRWFGQGGTVGLLRQVIAETVEGNRGRKISSMAYFQRPLQTAMERSAITALPTPPAEPLPAPASEWSALTSEQQKAADYPRWSKDLMRKQFPHRYGAPAH